MDVIPLDRIAWRNRAMTSAAIGAALAALVIAAVQTWRIREDEGLREAVRDLDGAVQSLHADLDQVRAASERERSAADAALRAAQASLEQARLEAESLRTRLAAEAR
jgi:hypothetical protein